MIKNLNHGLQGKIQEYVEQMVVPRVGVKKGDNGRVLVIGGSRLFHAASFWSAGMASRLVDMVHFSSPTMENNELMRVRAKSKFWEGIVVPWEEVEHYIEEDDVILIGPGMERGEETKRIVDKLLAKYPDKQWVVDGGALQEVEPNLLGEKMIVTPNAREMEILRGKIQTYKHSNTTTYLATMGVTVLAKGEIDVVSQGKKRLEIAGGDGGMVKGGTGDVLSGLVAGLYAKNSAMVSVVVASYANKQAGERLAKRVGPYYSPEQLLEMVPEVLFEITTR